MIQFLYTQVGLWCRKVYSNPFMHLCTCVHISAHVFWSQSVLNYFQDMLHKLLPQTVVTDIATTGFVSLLQRPSFTSVSKDQIKIKKNHSAAVAPREILLNHPQRKFPNSDYLLPSCTCSSSCACFSASQLLCAFPETGAPGDGEMEKGGVRQEGGREGLRWDASTAMTRMPACVITRRWRATLRMRSFTIPYLLRLHSEQRDKMFKIDKAWKMLSPMGLRMESLKWPIKPWDHARLLGYSRH